MEATSLCFRLLMLEFILLGTQVQNSSTQKSDAPFLRITPNRLQHFQLESVSFECGGMDGSAQLKRIKSDKDIDAECSSIKKTSTGSSCTIYRAYPTDSGEYWCETEGGQRSNSVNITVTAGSVVLESPVVPILEGKDVTLHCTNKKTYLQADFYKDDVFMESSPTGNMTIHNVSKSVEGIYKCSIPGVGESPGSWLFVIANPDSITSTPPGNTTLQNGSDSPHVIILLWVAVTIVMMVLVLLVVGFLHLKKCRVSSETPTAASQSIKDNHPVSGDDVADDPDGVTVVVTKQRRNTDEDEFSHQLVYSAVTIKPGLSSSTAATDPNSAEPDVLYSAVQMVKKTPE
ncbi:low affinity immunoglobulin gamma Fc region receptor II-c-like [Acanthopagrus latus]|uniref:low affinity immunoglobulin gamma Fc region receptor II-c-like n=1 Tax=Acanthopagrus latus TaxID=8177 RepID=UPI00187BCBAE|nr:low affinity immunoglobulin gamma Fc region receptor II-c-like [Acanthopagrus latus]